MVQPSYRLPRNQVELETAVINSVKRMNPAHADVVEAQYRVANVTRRWGSGAGFYTTFEVPEIAPRLQDNAKYPMDAELFYLKADGAEDVAQLTICQVPAEFQRSILCGAILLHNQQGLLTYLDCHQYGQGQWPEELYEFWFPDNEARN